MRISDWSSDVCSSDLAADVVGRARSVPLDEAVAQQRSTLERFWQAADVTIEGDAELEAAVRSCAFQVLQASAGNPGRAAPAKGLTGQGYEGHHHWDPEVFVTHALDLLAPEASRALPGLRPRPLPQARRSEERRVGKECVSTVRPRGSR